MFCSIVLAALLGHEKRHKLRNVRINVCQIQEAFRPFIKLEGTINFMNSQTFQIGRQLIQRDNDALIQPEEHREQSPDL